MSEMKAVDYKSPGDDETTKDVAQGELHAEELSAEDDKRILRRIDTCLLPIMAISYMFQFLDKSALSYTAIMGLRDDLKLQGTDYSWASSIYYFGYLIASYIAGVIMVRYPIGKTITASIITWGIILMLTAVAFNAEGLLANRFFLGVAESAIAPGLSVLTGMWYKRSEQPLRHGAWFMGNTCAGIFGGLVAYGIGHVQSIAPWKAVFLIFGAITVAWSFALFFLLPDTPMKAWFLSEEDSRKAIARVQENMTGIKSDKFKWYQCTEAFLDVKCWALFLVQLCSQIANGGVHSFGSIVIKGFGFSTLNTLLVQMLSFVFQLVFVLIATGGSTWFRNTRTYWMAWNLILSIIGAAMVRQISSDNMWARFMGYCLTIAYSANFPLTLAMSSSNFGGFTKKTTVNAMIFMGYCAGNIIGPQLFFDDEAPSYPSGFLAMMICYGIALMTCFGLRVYLIWENRRRDRMSSGDNGSEIQESLDSAFMDKTDKEIMQFRYVY
ncbi:major facilitator superfamily domain-containing protein [Dactylonectria estremocensis]|uniref:Major facilitator superfamily domain-containing protein n=1 Tax=Dactylonectria estremocensis TaxID=1079267 RepID=A0A9P9EDK4_9HYPO|nr:major facilitator superfamily domain-containing protein [Dactylonectria estremocensis]